MHKSGSFKDAAGAILYFFRYCLYSCCGDTSRCFDKHTKLLDLKIAPLKITKYVISVNDHPISSSDAQ